MKICSKYQALYASEQLSCIQCVHQAARKYSFTGFTLEIEDKQKGFKPDFFDTYAYLERHHFRFQAPGKLIVRTLKNMSCA